MEMGRGRRASLASSVLGKCTAPGCGEQVLGGSHLHPGGCLPVCPPPRPVPASESDPLERSELLVQEGSPGLGGPHLAFCIPTSPWTVCACSATSVVPNSATPWTAARQAALSMGVSRQESWSGLPCPPPGDLPDPGIKPVSPVSRCTWEVSVNSKLHPEPSS